MQFQQGQRVVVTASPFYGSLGTLVKPTHLLWRRAWLVELDSGRDSKLAVQRTQIVESALAPADEAVEVRSNKKASRASHARTAFSVLVPLAGAAWVWLPALAAAAFTALLSGLLVVWYAGRPG